MQNILEHGRFVKRWGSYNNDQKQGVYSVKIKANAQQIN